MSDQDQLILRLATSSDSDLLLRWRNDPSARRWFPNSEPISKNAHELWMNTQLELSPQLMWIGESSTRRIGSVRITPVDPGRVGSVSVVVDSRYRGSGAGSQLIHHVGQRAKELGYVELHAQVHMENAASISIFQRNGYVEFSRDDTPFIWLAHHLKLPRSN